MSNDGGKTNFPQHGSGVIQSRRESNRILQLISNIQGKNGILVRPSINGGLDIILVTPPIPFSGTAYVAGIKTTGLNSTPAYPWVKCNLASGAATEDAGPPSNPFPPNEEWYEKANHSGDIHVPRA